MTMPFERTRAVLQTKEFLEWVLMADPTAESFEQAKREARNLLRHFPYSIHLHIAHLTCPHVFGPPLDRQGPMPPGSPTVGTP